MADANPVCPPEGEIDPSAACDQQTVCTDNSSETNSVVESCTATPEFSTCAPATAAECYTPWLNDAFLSLPKAKRIDVIGTNGKGMYQFAASCPGVIMADGKGGFVFTDSPILDLPQLVGYVNDGVGGIATDSQGVAIEGDPPDFGYLMVQRDDNGEWMKLRGTPGKPSMVVWDNDTFQVVGMEEANVSVSRPDDECDEAELVGFATPDCDDGTPNILKRVASDSDGVFYFNVATGKTKITSICDVYSEEAERSLRIPFIPSCVSGQPIRFRGPTDKGAMLYWDSNSSEWVIMDLDTKACDPECGCATYLVPIYDCATDTWQITEEPDHVLHWKVWTDSGVNTSLDFTLPWPAIVHIYAQRRLIPNIGDTTVVSADIAVDNCLVTSPSDGGLVANLGEAATSMGLAILPLEAGDHNTYVTNDTTAGLGTPQWDGAWLKVYAHKITGCEHSNPPIGAGDIDEGTGGGGGGPAGPAGPKGDPGASGATGPPGPAGADGDNQLYEIDSCPSGMSLIWKTVVDDPVEDTDTFYLKGVSATDPINIDLVGDCVLNWSTDECVPCYDHDTGDPSDPNIYYSTGVTPTGSLIYVPITPDVVQPHNQYYIPCQAPDGDLAYQNVNIGTPPVSGYNYYAVCQDASGDIVYQDLSAILDSMGYVSQSVVP